MIQINVCEEVLPIVPQIYSMHINLLGIKLPSIRTKSSGVTTFCLLLFGALLALLFGFFLGQYGALRLVH